MSNKAPNIWPAEAFIAYHNHTPNKVWDYYSQRWVPARPMGYQSFGARLKAAWLVFTGRADAVIWPGGQ
jgi:hypothetical protein